MTITTDDGGPREIVTPTHFTHGQVMQAYKNPCMVVTKCFFLVYLFKVVDAYPATIIWN